ncbi:interphotoreceptor retinoid-binding protein [Thalassotalea loyana]|uniref:Interphotoreceptor retinoid-binding protein n=1 Tax=Thalassotalea loyana TaxID=280483 RepID=A0ABQ6HHA6_9GAMM|nr:S41 family peptidase [Thalassotalea loyana]GLX86854.1 interphotoreceptor retinoid-binding protein [Thalassotalea loyana]
MTIMDYKKITRVITPVCAGLMCSFSSHAVSDADDMPSIDCTDKKVQLEVLGALANQLTEQYIFLDKAKAFTNYVSELPAKSEFSQVKDCQGFTRVINDTLLSITSDKHLHINFSPYVIPEDTPESKQAFAKREQAFMQSLNFGFEKVERLPFNIGYINMTLFAPTEHGAHQLESAMNLLGYTNALIIDLRESRGGAPAMVDLLTSYFVDGRTNTSNIYYRNRDYTEERYTTTDVNGKHYGQERPLYILTSNATFSAAEDLAYTLKHLGRATIIGEVTGGGAHPGEVFRLTAHFDGFIPNGRSINPVTNTNWEGVGVQPDIETEVDKALNVAQQKILASFKNKEPNLARANRMQKRIERLKG